MTGYLIRYFIDGSWVPDCGPFRSLEMAQEEADLAGKRGISTVIVKVNLR